MSQTNTTPDPTNPKTVDDYKAAAALSTAQAEALDAQAKLIASQKALAKAQADDDAGAAQLAAATQAASIAAQKKALSDSQLATLKNTFTVPDSGYTGDIKAGDKAGGVEATLLAARALNLAAASIADKVALASAGSLVLYSGTDLPDFQALISYRTQSDTVAKALTQSVNDLDGVILQANALLPPKVEFVSPALIGLGLDAANKILGYFRTDYSVQGVAVNADDLLLINAMADALHRKGKTVSMPALYNADALLGKSAIVTGLTDLAEKRVQLQQKLDIANADAVSLTAASDKEKDPAKKKQLTDLASKLKTAADQGKVANALYDSFFTKLTTPDDKSKVPLASIIQQDAVRFKLDNGANLMTTKISSAGGTYYTRKNLWSFFGAMPFFTMGGVVVSYSVFNGKTGEVLSAGAVPLDGGFFKIGELPKELDGSPAKKKGD